MIEFYYDMDYFKKLGICMVLCMIMLVFRTASVLKELTQIPGIIRAGRAGWGRCFEM